MKLYKVTLHQRATMVKKFQNEITHRRRLILSQPSSRATLQVSLDTTVEEEQELLRYEPGDHFGIFPSNRPEIVDGILARLSNCPVPDKPVQLYILKETHSIQNGTAHRVQNSRWSLSYTRVA